MLYQTIVLEMLQDRPRLHEQLKRQKMLREAMKLYARTLKSLHEHCKQRLATTRLGSDPIQIASQAREMALQELEEDYLPSDSCSEDELRDSLDGLMTFLRDHTPTE